jgi:hypothetical protein
MEFFADNRQQRGYGHLCGRRSREARSGELAGEPYDMIVRQMELIIGKTEGTILGIPHAVPCRTAGGRSTGCTRGYSHLVPPGRTLRCGAVKMGGIPGLKIQTWGTRHCVQFDAAQHPVVRRRRRGSGLRLPFGHSGAPSEIAERDRDVGDAGGDSRRFAGLWRQQWRRLHGARLTVHHAGELYHHRNRHVRHAHRGGDGFSYSAVRQGPIRG